MEEIWKPVTGFENFYEISNKGRIKSLRRKVNTWNGQRTLEERILAAETSPLGYKRICLRDGVNKRRVFLHRLVAYEFIPNTDNKPQIDHIDGNPSNNSVENLRWVTAKENTNNPITKQRQKAGAKRKGIPKATQAKAHQAIRKKVMMCDRKTKQIIRTFESVIQAAKTMSICATGISAVCKKHRKTAGGYIWILFN